MWSPQQIARTHASYVARRTRLQASHETIYNAIYAHPKGDLSKDLIACLRQGRSTRKSRSAGTDRRGQIPEMINIHVRPPEVNDRVMPGHWEGDLIKGGQQPPRRRCAGGAQHPPGAAGEDAGLDG